MKKFTRKSFVYPILIITCAGLLTPAGFAEDVENNNVGLLKAGAAISNITPNLDDPIAGLRFVRHASEVPMKLAISQSFAFGGHNTALLLGAS